MIYLTDWILPERLPIWVERGKTFSLAVSTMHIASAAPYLHNHSPFLDGIHVVTVILRADVDWDGPQP